MGIVLMVILNNFSFQYASISRKIRNIMLAIYFFCLLKCWYVLPTYLLILILICSTNIMLLGQVFTLKRCFQSLNLVVEKFFWNKPIVQTPIIFFKNQKEKDVSIQHNINFDESWHTIFQHRYDSHDLSWCEVFFRTLCQYLL